MKVCEWLGPGYTSINSGKNAFNPIIMPSGWLLFVCEWIGPGYT